MASANKVNFQNYFL